AEFENRIGKLNELLSFLENGITSISKEYEQLLIKLIFQIATKIVGREIQMQPAPIVDLITHLIAEIQSAENIVIRINPADLVFIDALKERKVKNMDVLTRVDFQIDEDIAEGGCFVETNQGSIDATVPQRVEKAWLAIESKLPILDKDHGKP